MKITLKRPSVIKAIMPNGYYEHFSNIKQIEETQNRIILSTMDLEEDDYILSKEARFEIL